MGMVRWPLVFGSLALLLACGGGGGGGDPKPPQPAKATGLAYSDPSSGDFRLVRDPASTDTKLILRLVGSAASQGRGVAMSLGADAAMVDLVKVAEADTEYVQNGDVFVLGDAPRLLKGIKQNGTLHLTVAQKGSGQAKALDGTLFKVAIQFKAGAGLNVGTPIPISVTDGQYLPASGGPTAMVVAIGSLRAQ